MNIQSLNLIVLRSDFPEKLSKFYNCTLNIEFVYHKHGNGPYHYSTEINGLTMEIYKSSKNNKQNTSTRIGFKVVDLNDVLERVGGSSGIIITNPTMNEWGYSSVIQDSDGRKIDLVEL